MFFPRLNHNRLAPHKFELDLLAKLGSDKVGNGALRRVRTSEESVRKWDRQKSAAGGPVATVREERNAVDYCEPRIEGMRLNQCTRR